VGHEVWNGGCTAYGCICMWVHTWWSVGRKGGIHMHVHPYVHAMGGSGMHMHMGAHSMGGSRMHMHMGAHAMAAWQAAACGP